MTDTTATSTKVTLSIDGRAITVAKGTLLIAAAEQAGTYIPRFCYHPRMEPVGVCRMCLVEVDGPRGPTLTPACYVPAGEGMVVHTQSEKVKKAQDGVLEFLLANHPLDCPICDKGGECPLQDQTLAHGSGESRFIEEKRHFAKPIAIGELVLLDRERCIQCSRCTRFASEVAGDAAIDFAGRGDTIEVAPFPTEPFDSIFSGNTVQICPVGALTAKPYRFTARPWDLEQVESTCTGCAVGCRVAVQSSGNRLTRVLGLDADGVNQGWLCDKGRFTLDATHAEDATGSPYDPATRLTSPLVRRNGELVATTWSEALATAASLLHQVTPEAIGAIGGAALTNEGAFAWQRFFRDVVGTNSLDATYGDTIDPALLATLPAATIDDAAHARVLVTITGDLRQELPVLFLRVRQSIVKGTTSLVEFAAAPSALAGLAAVHLPVRPGETHLVAEALASDDASLAQLAKHPGGALISSADLHTARTLLGDGAGVVVVVGRANETEAAAVVNQAARTLAAAFPAARFLATVRRANTRGALDMGLHPSLRPGRQVSFTQPGRDALAQLRAAADGSQQVLVLLGGGLDGNVAPRSLATAALARATVIAVTGHGAADLAHADVVLPSTVGYERSGTVTNIEGRVTALAPKIAPPGAAWPDVAIAAELAEEFGVALGLSDAADTAHTVQSVTGYPLATVLAHGASDGLVVGRDSDVRSPSAIDPMAFPGVRSAELVGPAERAGAVAQRSTAPGTATVSTMADLLAVEPVALPAPDAYSSQLVLVRRLYDLGAAMRATSALHGLIEPAVLFVHPADADRMGVPDGGVVSLSGEGGTFTLPMRREAGVVRGTVVLPVASESADGTDVAGALASVTTPVVEIRWGSR
jgi:NADH-quinone oxidoreductase subunit G